LSSTRRPRRSTPRPNAKFRSVLPKYPPDEPRSSSLTGCRPSSTPTRYWCWRMDVLSSADTTRNCCAGAASMRRCGPASKKLHSGKRHSPRTEPTGRPRTQSRERQMARICKVLIVEDDDDVRALLGDIFHDEGFRFSTVKTGAEMSKALDD